MSDVVDVETGTFDDDQTPVVTASSNCTQTSSRPSTPELTDLLLEHVHVDNEGRPKPQPPLPTEREAIYNDETTIGEQDTKRWLSLSEAVTNVLQTHVERVQASDALIGEDHNPDGLSQEDLMMQFGANLSAPLPLPPYKPLDLASLLIPARQLPGMQMRDPMVTIGNKANVPSLPEYREGTRLVDLNLPFLGLVLSMQQEFFNLTPDAQPLQPEWTLALLKCQWIIFEDAAGAKLYHQRAWRYLSENVLPIHDEVAVERSTTQIYTARTMPLKTVWNKTARVYKSRTCIPLIRYGSYIAEEAVIITAHVGKVVIKLTVASQTETEIDMDALECFTSYLLQRARMWTDRVHIGIELEKVPAHLQLFRQQLFDAWTERAESLSKANTIPTSGIAEACAFCELESSSTLYCSGCRSVAYCSKKCQKQHWSQHRTHCSKELLLPLSHKSNYYKARLPEQQNSDA